MTDKQICDRIKGVLSASMMPIEMELECVRFLERRQNDGWIPVGERLPDHNKTVLVYCTGVVAGSHVVHIGSLDSGKFWFLRTHPGISSFPVLEWQVTHWMPLPDPPGKDDAV